MAKVKYTTNKPFKELYKKTHEPLQQQLEYLDFTLATVRLSKPFPKTLKGSTNIVKEIVFRGCNPDYLIASLDFMLKAFDFYTRQLLSQDSYLLEDIMLKINDLAYHCSKLAKLYDKNSLFYNFGFNANYEYKEKTAPLSLEQLEYLCGSVIGDLINYNIALRREFWELAARHLEYLRDSISTLKNSATLTKISNKIPVPLAVELTQLFKEKGYINNDVNFLQFENAICTLLSINKEAYKKSKSAFKVKTRSRYRNLEKIVDELS